MFGLSRLISLMIVFCMGFGLAAGLFVGIPAAVIASYSLRDLENTNLVNIPDEKFLLPDAPVDILDLNGIELYYEIKELQTFGDDLTLNLLKSRYGILFHEKLEIIMTDEAMNMPIKQLFSMDGLHAVLKNVYIGNIEGFQCMNADGSPDGDPKAEGAYWVNKEGNQITALEEIIADFTLDDFISGNIKCDTFVNSTHRHKTADAIESGGINSNCTASGNAGGIELCGAAHRDAAAGNLNITGCKFSTVVHYKCTGNYNFGSIFNSDRGIIHGQSFDRDLFCCCAVDAIVNYNAGVGHCELVEQCACGTVICIFVHQVMTFDRHCRIGHSLIVKAFAERSNTVYCNFAISKVGGAGETEVAHLDNGVVSFQLALPEDGDTHILICAFMEVDNSFFC